MKRLSLLAGPLLAGAIYFFLRDATQLAFEGKIVLALSTWMILWWIFEPVPLAVTALIPAIFFPFFKATTPATAFEPYADPLIFLFLGGFFMAQAMQQWNLHKRIAVWILQITGTDPKKMILGMMTATAFLSMWVSNTATMIMMLPMCISLIQILRVQSGSKNLRSFEICLMIGVAYAASIGGIGTLIGTPPNAFFAAFMQRELHQPFSFQKWFVIGLPLVMVFIPLTWFLLCTVLFPVEVKNVSLGEEFLAQQKMLLGKMQPVEWKILAVFSFVSFLWLTSDVWPRVFGAWFLLSDAGVALLGMGILFCLRANEQERILSWSAAPTIPWGILLLFGGGLSLAEGMAATGVTQFIGTQLNGLGHLPPFFTILVICTMIVFFSEIASNTATIAAFLPIVAALAQEIGVSPITLLLPATLAGSFGFMLPIATPPNALAYAYGFFSTGDLRRAGWWLDVLGVLIISAYCFTLNALLKW